MEHGEQNAFHFWRGFYAYHRKHGGVLRVACLRVALVLGMSVEYFLLCTLSVVRRRRDVKLETDRRRLLDRLIQQW